MHNHVHITYTTLDPSMCTHKQFFQHTNTCKSSKLYGMELPISNLNTVYPFVQRILSCLVQSQAWHAHLLANLSNGLSFAQVSWKHHFWHVVQHGTSLLSGYYELSSNKHHAKHLRKKQRLNSFTDHPVMLQILVLFWGAFAPLCSVHPSRVFRTMLKWKSAFRSFCNFM